MQFMEARTYNVIIEPCEEGGYWAHVPTLPGCFTQGETLEEVVTMAREAIQGFVQELSDHGQLLPVEEHNPRRLTLGIEVRTRSSR